ncbi:hypothetical protein [Nostoc sp. 2RC]|uniref:hypothetical protein n=1 Tax=Nostoc sp. 2RC TaxID=2485484 RepID=UPI0016239EA2|nr:hypothetical protein [Nostoc sp. 2RC]MBC1238706.1 hypothetical protein [Nostoc sp. 2RC]
MGRYSDISRGPELQDAYEKYQEWLKKSRAAKKAAYKTVAKPAADRVKVEREPGYILPFNSTNDKVYLETRVIHTAQAGQGSATANTARGLISDRFKAAPPTGEGDQTFPIDNYKFAKIILSQRTTTATTESESRITGDTYKRHRSDNVSGPFGRKSSTDEYSAAVKEIKNKNEFKTFVAVIGNRIGFTAEG